MNAVETTNIVKTYPNGTQALQGVTLAIRSGQIFGLLGPNGAGKTTLLNTLASLLTPDRGKVLIFGQDLHSHGKEIRSIMNICSGHANFAWSLTLQENLVFYAMLYGLKRVERKRKVEELIEHFSLSKYAHTRFDEVSTGTKQRLALAKSLLNDPKLLLLDEPTVGLDPDVALRIREYILAYHRKTQNTLVLTTHYMPEAQSLCEEIAFIKEGRILAQGTAAQIQSSVGASNLETAFLELVK